MKKIIFLMVLVFPTLSIAGEVNTNPAITSFDEMYEYWNNNRKVSNFRQQSLSEIINSGDPEYILASLFLQKELLDIREDQIKAEEHLSSYCYTYLNTISSSTSDSMKKCLNGTMLPSVLSVVNGYFKYKKSKKHWESIAKSCAKWNYDNVSNKSTINYGDGYILSNACSTQLSKSSRVNVSIPVEEDVEIRHSGVEKGYTIGDGELKVKNMIKSSPRVSAYQHKWDKITNYCPSGSYMVGRNHTDFYRNNHGSKKTSQTSYCVTNPHQDVYVDIIEKGCSQTKSLIKEDNEVLWNYTCQNWISSGLNDKGNLLDAIKGSVVPNKAHELTSSSQLHGDYMHKKKLESLNKYWSYKTQTSKFGSYDITNIKSLSYRNLGSSISGFTKMDENGVYKATPISMPDAELGTHDFKTSFKMINREKMKKGVFYTTESSTHPSPSSKFDDSMKYTYKYPILDIDTYYSTLNFNFYSQVYDFKDEVITWLTEENDWSYSSYYTCNESSLEHYKKEDLLGNVYWDFTSKYIYSYHTNKSKTTSPRAKRIDIKNKKIGVKPYSEKVLKTYSVCKDF